FFHNTHAFFLRAITAMPWYVDLDLARHGAQLIEPELNVALITSDGRALEWWTDIEKTIASFAALSARDAKTLRRWHDAFVPIVEKVLSPEARLAAFAAARARRAAFAHQRRPAAARDQRTLAARIREPRVRTSDHPGGPPLLQRAARGGPTAQRVRPPHRRAHREPRQGADGARRLGGSCARARSRGAQDGRRDRPWQRTQAHRGRGRPRHRHRNPPRAGALPEAPHT